jgi:hypothetical protein
MTPFRKGTLGQHSYPLVGTKYIFYSFLCRFYRDMPFSSLWFYGISWSLQEELFHVWLLCESFFQKRTNVTFFIYVFMYLFTLLVIA